MRALSPGTALLVALLLAAATGSSRAQQATSDTYTFEDEVTGLSIELPRSWEREDPRNAGQQLVEKDERFRRRRPDAPGAGVIFAARTRSDDGLVKMRPVISCTALPVPASQTLTPQDLRKVVEDGGRAILGQFEPDAAISSVESIDISGHTAFRLSMSRKGDAGGGGRFVALQRGGFVMACAGIYGRASGLAATRALDSIALRPLVPLQPAGSLRGIYAKFGCQVLAFDAAMHVADRQKGIKREDARAVREKVTFPTRAKQYGVDEAEYREYVARLTDDVYDHPTLDAEDLALYQIYKCDRVVNGLAFEPIERYEAMLDACPGGMDRKTCRQEALKGVVALRP